MAFKNCAPCKSCRTEINESFIMKQNINIAMPMFNFIEYSYNYSDTSESLWQFKRDEVGENNDLIVDNSPSFKYKSNIICNLGLAGARNNRAIN